MGAHRNAGKHRRTGRLVTACGVVLAAGMQVAPLAAASPVTDWGARARGPAANIETWIGELQSSAAVSNLNAVKTACRQIQNAAEDLRALLPAPSKDLTDEVSAGLSELRTGIRPCLTTGPNPSLHDISTGQKHIENAVEHLQSAKAIVQRG
jgi:hypothetical protein